MHLSGPWYRAGGAVVAGVGFSVTRLFVAEAVRVDTTLAFVVGVTYAMVRDRPVDVLR